MTIGVFVSYQILSRLGVPRKLRIEYEGVIYHAMNRGNRREAVFLDDADHELFLETQFKRLRKPAGRSMPIV